MIEVLDLEAEHSVTTDYILWRSGFRMVMVHEEGDFECSESIVLSALLYGAKTWPITVANGRRLEAEHHRWLRIILHVTWRDKITNKIIRERTRQDELGCIIRRKRLTWFGHVARMNLNRKAKQVLNWTPGRKRGRGPRIKIVRRPYAET